MRMKIMIVLIAASLLCGAAFSDTPEAVSDPCGYSFDSVSQPIEIKTAEDAARIREAFTRHEGESVTVRAPDGAEATLVSENDVGRTFSWTPSGGGLWVLLNSWQGAAPFTVRHAIFGTLGAGTEASPAKLVDDDELIDLVAAGPAGNGFVFMLEGMDGLFAALTVPNGFRLEESEIDGMWRIVASEDGCQYASAAITYAFDGKDEGPDRTIDERDVMLVAYSGDNWRRLATAASTLSFTAPSGRVTSFNLTGTGWQPLMADEPGRWSVSIESDEYTETATIRVRAIATTIILR